MRALPRLVRLAVLACARGDVGSHAGRRCGRTVRSSCFVAAALLGVPAGAQEDHAHAHGDVETLGTVHFPTSCRPEVAAAFTRATALLHSFGYEEARKGFEGVARRDADCGMAHWGVA